MGCQICHSSCTVCRSSSDSSATELRRCPEIGEIAVGISGEEMLDNRGNIGNNGGIVQGIISALQKRIAAREQSEIDKLVVGEYCNVGQVARQNDCRSIKAEAYHTAKVV